jgi:hypothetical protein
MVSNCANPGCGKPLHYLRDGRIYVFDTAALSTRPGHKRERHLEHYWLCGVCAQRLTLVQDGQGWVRILPKPALQGDEDDYLPSRHPEMAS